LADALFAGDAVAAGLQSGEVTRSILKIGGIVDVLQQIV
jgi:hypothetical protein